jgi:erythronate-4-phosphate dehydrogenase
VTGGAHPTLHLVNTDFLKGLKRSPILINAGRGEVVDGQALSVALDKVWVSAAVIDTWENEPNINRELLQKAYLGTPHIAGYSLEGKHNATRIVLEAFARHTGYDKALPLPALESSGLVVEAPDFASAALQIYSPAYDSFALKSNPSAFEELRNNYSLRREVSSYEIRLKSD